MTMNRSVKAESSVARDPVNQNKDFISYLDLFSVLGKYPAKVPVTSVLNQRYQKH